MPSALVTGANGFIGRHLVARLARDGFSIRALVYQASTPDAGLQGVDVVEGDIRDSLFVLRAVRRGDWIFHLAGKVHDFAEKFGSSEHDEVTVGGTRNLMEAAESNGARGVAFLSSAAVYGTDSECELDEGAACHPNTPYGRSKWQAERIVLERGVRTALHVTCLRPAMVYGPGCKGNLVRMIGLIRRGVFPPLPEFGNRRSLAFVDDVVEALLLAARDPKASGQCYNVTDGRFYTTRQIYQLVQEALGRRPPRWHVPVAAFHALAAVGDIASRATGRRAPFDSTGLQKLAGSAWFSCAKLQRELGYRPRGRLEDALPTML